MALTCMVAGLTVARLLLVVLFKKDKTGNCSSRQPDYGRNRFCTADFFTGLCTCCHRYGACRCRTGIYFPRHTQHCRQPVRFSVGNGIQCGPCYSSDRTDITEQPHGNYLARIQYRCVSLYDDCLPAHHASIV